MPPKPRAAKGKGSQYTPKKSSAQSETAEEHATPQSVDGEQPQVEEAHAIVQLDELQESVPTLQLGCAHSAEPSETFLRLFPRGNRHYVWQAHLPKTAPAPQVFDDIQQELKTAVRTARRDSAQAGRAETLLENWESLKPSLDTAVVLAQGINELANFHEQNDDGFSNSAQRARELTTIAENLLEELLKRATCIITGSQHPSLGAKVHQAFAADNLGVHPDSVQLIREFKAPAPPQRFASGARFGATAHQEASKSASGRERPPPQRFAKSKPKPSAPTAPGGSSAGSRD